MAGKTTRRSSGDFLFANNVTFADAGTTITTTDVTTGDPIITVNNAESTVPGSGAGIEVEAGGSAVGSLLYTSSGGTGTWSVVGEGSTVVDFNNATFSNFSISSLTNLNVTNLVSNNVDIGGGAIDGTTIGSTSQSTGSFTDLTATGTVSLGTSVSANEFVGNITGNIVGDVKNSGGATLLDISSGTLTAAVTGDVTGDIRATGGQLVLDNGTNGTDATITATLTGNIKAANNAVIVDTTTATFNGQVSGIANHDTDVLSEGSTNLYFTDARADGRITSASLASLSNVNSATPVDGQILTWDNSNSYWKPGTLAVTVSDIQVDNDITTTAVSGSALSNEAASGLSTAITPTAVGQKIELKSFVRYTVNSSTGSTAFIVRLYRNKGLAGEKILAEHTEYEASNLIVKKQANFSLYDEAVDTNAHTYSIHYDASSTNGTLTPNPTYNSGGASENYIIATRPVVNGDIITSSSTHTLTNKQYTSPVLNTQVTGSAVLNDSSFGSASATTIATSSSIKSYVDSQVQSKDTLGELNDVNTTGLVTGSILKYDGSDWVVGTDTDTGLLNVAEDTTPQLGGSLDLNGNDITGTGNLNTTGNAQFSGNLTISGNLNINGTTTTIDVTQLEVDDPLIYLNRNAGDNSTNTTDAGVLIERGSSEHHAGMIWQESTDRFKFLTSSSITSSTTVVSNIVLADIEAATAHVTATTAQYADLAELYVTDSAYEPGTVVIFGGTEEVTQSITPLDHRIAGVVSGQPAYLMNNEQKGNTVAVALKGKVPVNVIGPVRKGDLIVSSDTPGVGQAHPGVTNCVYVIGKCIEDDDTENLVRLINCVV